MNHVLQNPERLNADYAKQNHPGQNAGNHREKNNEAAIPEDFLEKTFQRIHSDFGSLVWSLVPPTLPVGRDGIYFGPPRKARRADPLSGIVKIRELRSKHEDCAF